MGSLMSTVALLKAAQPIADFLTSTSPPGVKIDDIALSLARDVLKADETAEAVVRAAIDMLPAFNAWKLIPSVQEDYRIKRLVETLRSYRVLHPYTGPGTAWEVELAT